MPNKALGLFDEIGEIVDDEIDRLVGQGDEFFERVHGEARRRFREQDQPSVSLSRVPGDTAERHRLTSAGMGL